MSYHPHTQSISYCSVATDLITAWRGMAVKVPKFYSNQAVVEALTEEYDALTVIGKQAVVGDVSISGILKAGDTSITGDLAVTGLTETADLTVSGTTTLNGTVLVNGDATFDSDKIVNLNGENNLNGPLTATGSEITLNGVALEGDVTSVITLNGEVQLAGLSEVIDPTTNKGVVNKQTLINTITTGITNHVIKVDSYWFWIKSDMATSVATSVAFTGLLVKSGTTRTLYIDAMSGSETPPVTNDYFLMPGIGIPEADRPTRPFGFVHVVRYGGTDYACTCKHVGEAILISRDLGYNYFTAADANTSCNVGFSLTWIVGGDD